MMKLWYKQPAEDWNGALPIGNGPLGAMIFGGVAQERLQLNEDTLWTGGPHNYNRSDAHTYLETVRELILNGNADDAEELLDKEMMATPNFIQAYQPMVDLAIDCMGHDSPMNYQRELNITNAVASVSYSVDGVAYRRQYVASHPDKVIAGCFEADTSGNVNLRFSFSSPQPEGITITNDIRRDGADLAFGGQLGSRDCQALCGPWDGEGLTYGGRLSLTLIGGQVQADGDDLLVSGADRVEFRLALATNYVSADDISGDVVQRLDEALSLTEGKPFEQLLADHGADYCRLFNRVKLELPPCDASDEPTDSRICRYAAGTYDAALEALLFQYGRYLLISCSRPGSQPANLQGNWNAELAPQWGSKYTININTEMNYWPAEVTNLSELNEPLFGLIRDLVPKGRETAKAYYNAPGWVAHHNTDLWRNCAPVDFACCGVWPMSSSWFCTHLWEHYQYTCDKEFLESTYPIMREACEFYLDFLTPDKNNPELLVTNPSHSPEHGGLTIAATMDNQILRDLFGQTVEAARVLGNADAPMIAAIQDARTRLPQNTVGRLGQLQEWLEDIDNPENTHRHVSHLWGVYPSAQISTQTPELLEAAKKSLEFRGDLATGWSIAWKVNLWARFRDGDRALKVLGSLLKPQEGNAAGLYVNMFDAHPPFQIDGNLGVTAGIAEMLMQSHETTSEGVRILDVLPALPSAWDRGRVSGLRARGGFTVDLSWKDNKLTIATIAAANDSKVLVRFGSDSRELTLAAGENRTLTF